MIPYFSPVIREIITGLPIKHLNRLEEIRLRIGRPLWIKFSTGDWFITPVGTATHATKNAYIVTEQDLTRTLAAVSENSVYALEEELRRGFITVCGGHRVGLAGKAVVEAGRIKNLKEISSLVFRVARDVQCCSERVLEAVMTPNHEPLNTIIISPPGCGKTTMLRDLACQLSNGTQGASFNVTIVDERSELAGCFQGRPQLMVGDRTDVLDGCPKAEGMIMAVRALAPDVVVTDEIGRPEDAEAIRECLNAGVRIFTSAHGASLEEVANRPALRSVFEQNNFQIAIILSRRRGPATIEQIIKLDQVRRQSH